MKTINLFLAIALSLVTIETKSINQVTFGVEVIVEHKFSPKELNVTIHSGEIKNGSTVLLEKHSDYLRAMKDKYTITGFTKNNAIIQAFYMNEKVSLDDAFALMNNYNSFDELDLNYEKAVPNDFLYLMSYRY